MMTRRARVSDIARLRREVVSVNPTGTYTEIGLRSFGRGTFHKDPVTGAALGTKRVFEIHAGDLLLSNVFAWEGAIAVAGDSDAGLIGSHRYMTYVVDPDRADARYVRSFFLSANGLELIRRASPGSAGRNRTLGIAAFERLELPFPPLKEQQEVAARIDRVSAAATRVRALVEHCGRVGTALMASLAHRPDVSDEEKQRSGWRKVRLREVMSESSYAEHVDGARTYPNVGMLSFGRGLFEKAPIEGSITSANTLFRIRAGQFIYSRLFAFEGAYGNVPDRFDGYYVSNEFPAFDVDASAVDAAFLAAYFRSPDVWRQLAAASRGLGNRRQRVHPETLLNFEVWLPPRATQTLAVGHVEHLAAISTQRGRQLQMVQALEAASLNNAFAAA
jgi:type I restriction enzyme S subunit